MISIDNIGTLLTESGSNHIRIYDRTGQNHLLDIDASDPAAAYEKLQMNAPILSGYGVLTIKAGDDVTHKGNMSRASIWKVFFKDHNNSTGSSLTPAIPINTGYSKEYIETTIALRSLQLQMEFDKRERELKDKFSGGDEEKYFKYVPLLGSFLGISDTQMMEKLKMCQMMGGLSGIQSNTQSRLTVEGTDQEKEKIVEQLVPEIFNKVDKNKFISVLQAVNDNPEFLESAYAYMSLINNKNSSVNGILSTSTSKLNNSDDNVYIGYVNSNDDENFNPK